MDKKLYYLCRFQLNGSCFVIWYTNDDDGLLHESTGRLFTFSTEEGALTHAAVSGLILEDGPPMHFDFDSLARWCERPSAETIDCSGFLNAWNMLFDAGALQAGDFDRDVYDKLFWGNNLPAVTPLGETYTPRWTLDEMRKLQLILGRGIDRLRAKLEAAAMP